VLFRSVLPTSLTDIAFAHYPLRLAAAGISFICLYDGTTSGVATSSHHFG